MENPVIIFGTTGIAHSALEIMQSNQIVVYGFLDDDDEKTHGTEINDIPVLGATDDHGFLKLIGKKCEAFVASDDNNLRKEWVSYLKETRKVMPMNAVHSSAHISESSSMGHGNFINAGVIISNNVVIGHHTILNSGVILEQRCEVGDFVQIGAGTVIGSDVTIGEEVFIGSGVTIVAGVKIGKGARIGAGSVVVSEVAEGTTVFGNPAKEV